MMTKTELEELTDLYMAEMKSALLTIYNALNRGQQKKLMKDAKAREIFERFHVFN